MRIGFPAFANGSVMVTSLARTVRISALLVGPPFSIPRMFPVGLGGDIAMVAATQIMTASFAQAKSSHRHHHCLWLRDMRSTQYPRERVAITSKESRSSGWTDITCSATELRLCRTSAWKRLVKLVGTGIPASILGLVCRCHTLTVGSGTQNAMMEARGISNSWTGISLNVILVKAWGPSF